MTNEQYARPVAYMLVRDVGASRESAREQLRTDVRVGFLTNQTLEEIERRDGWRLAQVIGPFDSMRTANAFREVWIAMTVADEKRKATRGPIVRFSRGAMLAESFGYSVWADFSAAWNTRNVYWDLRIADSHVIACRRDRIPEALCEHVRTQEQLSAAAAQ